MFFVGWYDYIHTYIVGVQMNDLLTTFFLFGVTANEGQGFVDVADSILPHMQNVQRQVSISHILLI